MPTKPSTSKKPRSNVSTASKLQQKVKFNPKLVLALSILLVATLGFIYIFFSKASTNVRLVYALKFNGYDTNNNSQYSLFGYDATTNKSDPSINISLPAFDAQTGCKQATGNGLSYGGLVQPSSSSPLFVLTGVCIPTDQSTSKTAPSYGYKIPIIDTQNHKLLSTLNFNAQTYGKPLVDTERSEVYLQVTTNNVVSFNIFDLKTGSLKSSTPIPFQWNNGYHDIAEAPMFADPLNHYIYVLIDDFEYNNPNLNILDPKYTNTIRIKLDSSIIMKRMSVDYSNGCNALGWVSATQNYTMKAGYEVLLRARVCEKDGAGKVTASGIVPVSFRLTAQADQSPISRPFKVSTFAGGNGWFEILTSDTKDSYYILASGLDSNSSRLWKFSSADKTYTPLSTQTIPAYLNIGGTLGIFQTDGSISNDGTKIYKNGKMFDTSTSTYSEYILNIMGISRNSSMVGYGAAIQNASPTPTTTSSPSPTTTTGSISPSTTPTLTATPTPSTGGGNTTN